MFDIFKISKNYFFAAILSYNSLFDDNDDEPDSDEASLLFDDTEEAIDGATETGGVGTLNGELLLETGGVLILGAGAEELLLSPSSKTSAMRL